MLGLISKKWGPYKYILKEFNQEEKIKLQENIKFRANIKKLMKTLPYFQVSYEEIFYKKVGITRINSYLNIEQDNSDIDMFDIHTTHLHTYAASARQKHQASDKQQAVHVLIR